jgi:translation elongation factor EF-Tu-like GTPase
MKLPARAPDIEASIRFLRTEDGGRLGSAVSGYQPQHEISEDLLTSGRHEYLDCDSVAPGTSARARIWFIAPERLSQTLWIGRELRVLEGNRLVAVATITALVNNSLARPACDVTHLRPRLSNEP